MPTLSSFDRDMDETIVKRGRDYFRKGHVRDLELVDDGMWRALVEGTEAYDTRITLMKDSITQHRCNCPYDLGQYCKHEVAVLYAIRERTQGDAGIEGSKPNQKGVKKQPKGRTVREQVEEAALKLGESELRHLVVESALDNQGFRRRLLRSAPEPEHILPADRKQEYIDSIRDCMEDNADRHGFIGWEEAHGASEAADELCRTAEQFLVSEKYAEALPIAQALLETIYPELGRMDDSNGEFGGCIDEGWIILRKIADKIAPTEPLGEQLFMYCIDQAGKKVYDGWHADDDFFRIAIKLVTPGDREKLLQGAIDRVLMPLRERMTIPASVHKGMRDFCEQVDDYKQEHNFEAAAELTAALLQAVGKMDEAYAFMREYLQYPDIRMSYLEHLIDIGKLAEAKDIAKKGIAIANEKRHAGTSRKFEELLVTIADKERDYRTKQALLEQFFFDRFELEEYRRWKLSFSDPEAWQRAYESAIVKMKTKMATDALLNVYQEEGQWQEFLACIQSECKRLGSVSAPYGDAYSFLLLYEKQMMEKFPDDFAKLAVGSVASHLVRSTGRKTYQEVCRFLRRLRKHGYEQEVYTVSNELREKFNNRRALLQELGKVK